eukprot:1159823-Pelagomonas_calceolata.AAC.6
MPCSEQQGCGRSHLSTVKMIDFYRSCCSAVRCNGYAFLHKMPERARQECSRELCAANARMSLLLTESKGRHNGPDKNSGFHSKSLQAWSSGRESTTAMHCRSPPSFDSPVPAALAAASGPASALSLLPGLGRFRGLP